MLLNSNLMLHYEDSFNCGVTYIKWVVILYGAGLNSKMLIISNRICSLYVRTELLSLEWLLLQSLTSFFRWVSSRHNAHTLGISISQWIHTYTQMTASTDLCVNWVSPKCWLSRIRLIRIKTRLPLFIDFYVCVSHIGWHIDIWQEERKALLKKRESQSHTHQFHRAREEMMCD